MSILENIQENIRFRVQSARAMIMGGSNRESASPVERRRKIMEKNRELVMGAAPNWGSGDDSSSTATVENVRTTRRSRSSGSVSSSGSSTSSESRSSRRGTSSGESYIGSKVKDMSSVERGTAQRASDRGFN